MPDLISEDAEFTCNFCTGNLKLKVIQSSFELEGLDCANETNCFFPPPGGNCSFPPGAPPSPCPGLPPGLNTSPGQSDVTLDNQTALGTGCSFTCLKAQSVAQSTSGQTAATHNEASAGEEALSLALDLIPVVGTLKSVLELITGTDAVTGEEVSRAGSAAGIGLGLVPGGKALVKGKKAQRVAKAAAKRLAKKEDVAIKKYAVYMGKARNADGTTKYVGITKQSVKTRAAQHIRNDPAKKDIVFEKLDQLPELTKKEARCVEQALIERYGGKDGGQLLNKVNSISPKRPDYAESVQLGEEILTKAGYLK